MSRRSRWTLGVAVAVSTVVTGCGVPSDIAPVALDTVEPSHSRSSHEDNLSPRAASAKVTIFMVHKQHLVAVRRQSDQGSGPQAALRALFDGASREDETEGRRSVVPAADTLLHATVVRGVLTIDVPDGFDRLSATQQVVAMAQLVYTATVSPGVVGVRLVKHDEPVDVPTGSGTLVSRPVARSDYPELAPV